MIIIDLTYICSPLRGNVEENIRKANEYSRQAALQGDCPVAPHCLFTQYLNDGIPEERRLGVNMGLDLLSRCNKLLVCGDTITEGMKEEISEAFKLGIPVKSTCLSMEQILDCVPAQTAVENSRDSMNFV